MAIPTIPQPTNGLIQRLHQGAPLMIDRENSASANAGTVEVVGLIPHCVDRNIETDEGGAFARRGGVRLVPKASGGGTAIGSGVKVFWNAGANQVATNGSSLPHFGWTTIAAADGDTHTLVEHDPDGSTSPA